MLFADRFLPLGAGRFLDAASGGVVTIVRQPSGSPGDRAAWLDRCARLTALWHPHVAELIDFGFDGADSRFEAFPQTTPLARRDGAVVAAARSVVWFLKELGLTAGRPLWSRLRLLGARVVLMPDRWTGYPAGAGAREEGAQRRWTDLLRGAARPAAAVPGLRLHPRTALRAVIDVLGNLRDGGVERVSVTGGPGSGLTTIAMALAREGRRLGFVPVRPAVADSHPLVRDAIVDRFVLLLDDGCDEREPMEGVGPNLLLSIAVRNRQPALLVGFSPAPDARIVVPVDPIPPETLVDLTHVWPPGRLARSRLQRAADRAAGWPGPYLAALRDARPLESSPSLLHVSETQPEYGPIQTPAPAPFSPGLARWRARSARAMALAGTGRHAAAERLLREAAAGLQRHGDPDRAEQCALALGRLLLDRGRPADARATFEAATAAGGSPSGRRIAAVGVGLAWIDEGRLREAEAALRAATAGDAGDREALVGLARCLFWQGRYDEASTWIAPLVERGDRAALRRAAAIALAHRDVAEAGRLAASAIDPGAAPGEEAELARAHAVAARTVGAVRDLDAVERHCRTGLLAARRARAPLAALDVRLAHVAALWEAGQVVRARRRLRSVLRMRTERLAPLWRARVDHLRAIVAEDAGERSAARAAVAAFVRSSGAAALDRFRADAMTRELVEAVTTVLEICHQTEDERAALARICAAIRDRVRAAGVGIVAAPRSGAGLGFLITAGTIRAGYAAARALDSGLTIPPGRNGATCEAAVPVRYGGSIIAALTCRWSLDATVDARSAMALLEAAAAAVAPAARALVDRQEAAASVAPRDGTLIGAGAAMESLTRTIRRAAAAPFPVLIEGESGVGKELVARTIHRESARRARRFSAVNCAALPDDLLEAELFGHARGAFTGAGADRPGLFEEADGGTLFLDEVSELSPRAQAKLLRAIQEGEVRRIGENLPRRVDVRIVAASNRRLDAEVGGGRFREDLLYRLAVLRLSVPPLRERPEDIAALAHHFWRAAAERVGCRATLDSATISALAHYHWPGNVRELQNVMAALAVHAPRRGRVGPSALPAHIGSAVCGADPADKTTPPSLDDARRAFDRGFVAAALARAGGHHERAADALRISRQGLAKLVRRLGLEPETVNGKCPMPNAKTE
jgi:DNA-binding NtrC family response regulator/tetratricopeptide (TPR) repeat protein